MECHCNMSIFKARVGTKKKTKKVWNIMPKITFCFVQYPLKLLLSSKKQVKNSKFEV